jgi:hypothetical protein
MPEPARTFSPKKSTILPYVCPVWKSGRMILHVDRRAGIVPPLFRRLVLGGRLYDTRGAARRDGYKWSVEGLVPHGEKAPLMNVGVRGRK